MLTTRDQVRELLAAGHSRSEVARHLGLRRSTVSYHARALGWTIDERFGRRHDWAEIQRYYDAGHTRLECLARFGCSPAAWNDARRAGRLSTRPAAAPLASWLIRGGPRRTRFHLKNRLLDAGLKREVCEDCGLSEWRSRPLTLELHHVNGDGGDNRLENLRLLCPNCHAQTDTWGGRNKGRLPRPSRGQPDGMTDERQQHNELDTGTPAEGDAAMDEGRAVDDVRDIENDPAYNPESKELKDLKGG